MWTWNGLIFHVICHYNVCVDIDKLQFEKTLLNNNKNVKSPKHDFERIWTICSCHLIFGHWSFKRDWSDILWSSINRSIAYLYQEVVTIKCNKCMRMFHTRGKDLWHTEQKGFMMSRTRRANVQSTHIQNKKLLFSLLLVLSNSPHLKNKNESR